MGVLDAAKANAAEERALAVREADDAFSDMLGVRKAAPADGTPLLSLEGARCTQFGDRRKWVVEGEFEGRCFAVDKSIDNFDSPQFDISVRVRGGLLRFASLDELGRILLEAEGA